MKRIQLLIAFTITSMILLSFNSINAQQKVNKRGQYTNVIHVKFKSDRTQKLEVELKGRASKVAKNDDFVHINLKDVDARNKKFKAKSLKRLFRPAGKYEEKHRKHGLHLWYEIRFEGNQEVSQVVSEYKDALSVAIAEPVYEIHFIDKTNLDEAVIPVSENSTSIDNKNLLGTPNDPRYNEQWHYKNTGQSPNAVVGMDISLVEAWEIETGDAEVVVAIEDTGFDVNHPDLKGNVWVNNGEIPGNGIDDDNNGYIDDIHGYNFADDTGVIAAGSHGTHVAGTVAAETNNGVGVAGVAGGSGSGDGVKLMATPIFGLDKKGSAEAFIYAADNGAVISQNSWGYGVITATINAADKAAIDYFIANAGGENAPVKGGVVIFAAGNNGVEGNFYPGRYDPILSVASIANSGKKASYSNYGTWIDISAPGGDQTTSGVTAGVLSTIPGGYGYKQGTSMACPHAAGVAALVASKFKGKLSAGDLKRIMENSTDPIDHLNSSYTGKLGSGMINALRYRVRYRNSNGNWAEISTDRTTLKLSGLSKKTRYEVQVRAESITKVSPYSSITSFTTLELGTPNGIAISSISDATAIVTWNTVSDATKYQLRYKKEKEMNWNTISETTSLSSQLSDLVFNTFYEVQVKAINSTTSSIYSESVTFLTKDNGSGGCNGIDAWDSSIAYSDAGTKVVYNKVIYQNKWWTQGDVPGTTSHWGKVGECDTSGNTPPIVTITNPINNQVFEQETLTAITLSANASDTDGTISSIQFDVNGASLNQGNNVSWLPSAFGSYDIKVTVIDDKGATAIDQVTIVIRQSSSNQSPSVAIISPTNNQVFEQPSLTAITLSANASDTDGTISSMQFDINGTSLNQGNNVSWLPSAFGSYDIKVTVFDDKGATATDQVTIVIRQSSSNQPPNVTITEPLDGHIFEQENLTAITLSANASDTDGTISSIQFEVNGSFLSQGNNVSWLPSAFGSYDIKVTATDNDGATASSQVSITINEVVTGGDCQGITPWDAATEYAVKGIKVSHKNNIYVTKWWTQNNEPGTGGPWGPWELVEPCSTNNLKTSAYELAKKNNSFLVGIKENQIEIVTFQRYNGTYKFSLYGIDGKHIQELLSGYLTEGVHRLHIDVSSISSGLYLIKSEQKGMYDSVKRILISN